MTDAATRLTAALYDRYVIERELGAGGMATVYLAHDVRHDRKVALKVLRPELAAILGGERFLQEIKTTANLQHPHILPLHDSGTVGRGDGGTEIVYYVMPYVEGESLRDRLKREHQLPVDDAIRIASEVADALEYAHGHGIVHRDIKPENILLHGGHALVADFGIALAASRSDGGTRMTETGMSLGTPHYMAPEQAMGEREITPKADIYALGCVLYEMLTGEPPFTGPTAQAIIARVMTEQPRSLTIQRHTIPAHIEAVARRALEKLPADRFSTAQEFGLALRNPGFTAVAVPTAPSAGPRRTLLLAARSLLPWLITAAALVAAALGWLRQPPVTPNQPSVRFSHESDSLHQIASLCCGPPVAISPDGRFIAYEGGMSDGQYLFIRASDQLRGRRLDGTTRARNLFFSDDSEWVGFTVGNALRKVPVGGGAPVTVAELPARMMGATWTATNEIILSLPDSGGLFAVSADGGALRRLTTPDPTAGEAVHTLPHYVPGENVVLFSVVDSTGAAGSAKVAALWLRSGRPRTVSPGSHPQFASGHLVTVRDGGILLAQPLDVASGDTTGPAVRLADGIVARPFGMGEYAISRHGTLVHSARLNSAATLVMVSGDGVERRLRTSFTADQVAHFDNPRLSPDGRRLIVAGYHDREGRHIGYLVDVQRGSSLRLTFDADTEFLEWTPDGQSVVYVRDRTAIATRRVDRSGEERFITRLTGTRIAGRLTLGGGRMAFAVQGRSNTDIWSAALGASDSAHPYLATSFNESAPALSPDGRWLAYVSDETGRSEVYVTAFHDAAGRTTVSVDGGLEPQWSRDGRSLYFRTPGGDVVIASLGIVGGNLETLSRRVLFRSTHERSGDGAEFDVTPRGDQFLMVGVSGVGGGLVITTNAIR